MSLSPRQTRFALIAGGVLVLALAVAGLFWGVSRANKDFRARNAVERVILGLLVAASSIAILTTIGIVGSMATETFDFFTKYPLNQVRYFANFNTMNLMKINHY